MIGVMAVVGWMIGVLAVDDRCVGGGGGVDYRCDGGGGGVDDRCVGGGGGVDKTYTSLA